MELVKKVEELPVDERPFLLGRHIFETSTADMAWVSIKPGSKMPVHVHEDGDQLYYILSGEGALDMDGKRYELKAGMAVFIPRKVEHNTENTGSEMFEYVEFRAKG